jgi:hypothetical protein
MERFNITVPKKYTTNGEEKTAWNQVGKLVKFEAKDGKPESYILELHMHPDTKFAVFKDEPRTANGADASSENGADAVPF